jgi:hypothetical protein
MMLAIHLSIAGRAGIGRFGEVTSHAGKLEATTRRLMAAGRYPQPRASRRCRRSSRQVWIRSCRRSWSPSWAVGWGEMAGPRPMVGSAPGPGWLPVSGDAAFIRAAVTAFWPAMLRASVTRIAPRPEASRWPIATSRPYSRPRDDQPAPQGQRANRSLAPPGAVGLTPDSDGLAAPHAQPHLDSRAEGEQTEIGGHVPVRGGQHADPEVAAHRWDASRCLGLRQDTASHR